MPIQRRYLLAAVALTACIDDPLEGEVGSEIGGAVANPGPPGPTPAPPQFRSEFCRKLKAASVDEKKVMAAVIAAEAYNSDHPNWTALEKEGLVRIQFNFAGPALLGNHNFSAQLYADKNNYLVPGGCFALAVEGTQWGKGWYVDRVNDVWTDLEASEIRRLGVLNDSVLDGGAQLRLPGGPPSPLYVAAGFEQVAAHAAKLVDEMIKNYPELLPTSGDVQLDLLAGHSMGGAIAGVLAHSIEHFLLQMRLPGRDANARGTCPTEASPVARIVNPSGGFLYQAPRAIATVGNVQLPAKPTMHHMLQEDDFVPQLPTGDMRSVQTGAVMVPVDPTAAPNLTLSHYHNWANPQRLRWSTTRQIRTTPVPIVIPPVRGLPGIAFAVTVPTGITDKTPCSDDPGARANEMRLNVACDGNTGVSAGAAAPPKDLDSTSGFIKYAFAYAAGRVPDENFGPLLRPDNELNNRYPAQLVGGLPIPPDSLVGKSCKWGTYCNNPVGTWGMFGTMMAPVLQYLVNGFGAALTQNLYFWNPVATATFAGELATAAYATWRFHDQIAVSVAVGRLLNPALMIQTLDWIPTETTAGPWASSFTCASTQGLLGLCVGDAAPAPPGGGLGPVACATEI